MDRSDPDRDEFAARTGLGPPLFEAAVSDLIATLHPSGKNGYEWMLHGPGILVGGVLGRVWEGLQVGVEELIIGVAPRGAVAAEARVGESDGCVPVHFGAEAYWLVVPLAQDVTLTFEDAKGAVVWEYQIPAWHWARPVLEVWPKSLV